MGVTRSGLNCHEASAPATDSALSLEQVAVVALHHPFLVDVRRNHLCHEKTPGFPGESSLRKRQDMLPSLTVAPETGQGTIEVVPIRNVWVNGDAYRAPIPILC